MRCGGLTGRAQRTSRAGTLFRDPFLLDGHYDEFVKTHRTAITRPTPTEKYRLPYMVIMNSLHLAHEDGQPVVAVWER